MIVHADNGTRFDFGVDTTVMILNALGWLSID